MAWDATGCQPFEAIGRRVEKVAVFPSIFRNKKLEETNKWKLGSFWAIIAIYCYFVYQFCETPSLDG